MGDLMKGIGTAIGVTGVAILIVLLVIIGPVIGIWSINTLFHTNTDYNFWTWLAALLFFGMLKRS